MKYEVLTAPQYSFLQSDSIKNRIHNHKGCTWRVAMILHATQIFCIFWWWGCFGFNCTSRLQGRSVHIRTYARAYSWNLENIYFSFPESIFIIKSGWLINLSHYMLVSLPVWREDIWPFACNLLVDSVTVVPFSRKHYTLPIIAFSFVFIHWKFLAENAGNGISEPLNLKHFRGSMSPYLPSLQYPASEVQSFFPCVHLQNLWSEIGYSFRGN